MLKELVKIVFSKVYPGLLILLNLLQDWLVLIFNFKYGLIQFIDGIFVILLGHLRFVFDVARLIYYFLDFIQRCRTLRLTQESLLNLDFQLLWFLADIIILSLTFGVLRFLLIQIMIKLFCRVKLRMESLIVMVDVHIKWFDQIISDQYNSFINDSDKILHSILHWTNDWLHGMPGRILLLWLIVLLLLSLLFEFRTCLSIAKIAMVNKVSQTIFLFKLGQIFVKCLTYFLDFRTKLGKCLVVSLSKYWEFRK